MSKRRLSSGLVESFVRLRSDGTSKRARHQVAETVEEDPEFAAGHHELETLWERLGELNPSPPPGLTPLGSQEEADHSERLEIAPGRMARIVVCSAAAAMVLIALVGGWFADEQGSVHETIRGESEVVTLADGSTIQLNSFSKVTVQVDGETRRAVLERGEAFFSVAPDLAHPFSVIAGQGIVEVLGTEFNVRLGSLGVTTTVLEGSIRVSQTTPDGSDRQIVAERGQVIAYDAPGSLREVPIADQQRVTAWREGRLIFSGEALWEVIEEVNRHSDHQIVIADGSLRELSMYGVFRAGDTDSVLSALERAFPIRVKQQRRQSVLLRRGP